MRQKSPHGMSIVAALLWAALSISLAGCGKKAEPEAQVAEGALPTDTVSTPKAERIVEPIQHDSSTTSNAVRDRNRSLDSLPQQKSAEEPGSETASPSESADNSVQPATPVANAQDSIAPHKIVVPRRALRHTGH